MAVGKTRKKLNAKASRGSGGGGSGDLLHDIQTTRTTCIALLATGGGTGSSIVTGQGYIFDNVGSGGTPTGIKFIRIRGIDLLSGNKGFSDVAEAYITTLDTWVPCRYNVTTNVISGEPVLWAGDITEVAGLEPFIVNEHTNLFSASPSFAIEGTGKYRIEFPQNMFSLANYIPTFTLMDITGSFSKTSFYSAGKILIESGLLFDALYDDILSTSYIEIKINLSSLI